MIVEAAGTPVRCIFVNLTLRCKRPINPAYPRQIVTLGDHLRVARLDRGLMQSEVAKILKVTTNTVTGWELNWYSPQVRMVKRITQFLGYFPSMGKPESLGERLRQARQILGHSQEQAAKRMRCDESNIRQIELGKRDPGMKVCRKIERYIFEAKEKLRGQDVPFARTV
ncbi:MAG TPA: helix-turn-helix transcriptional regulator [Saprospiraceae bacterium]|nr:helix-turn-helix transcriptional regulator [Saprospiraceae bacterium]